MDCSAQNITTVAGTGTAGYNGDGIAATSAQLFFPWGVFVDASGNVYVADESNNRIRKVTPSGNITTVAGTGVAGYNGDGISATNAQLNYPEGVFMDGSGNLYIADGYRIRKVTPSGNITTVAGTGTAGYNGDGILATTAKLNLPYGLFVDASGNLYFADVLNHRVRKVTASTGIITTIAGTGVAGYNGDGIAATTAQLDRPWGVFGDASGNVYIPDYLNNRIRKVNTSGNITTIAGTGTAGYNGDGILATTAQINGPWGVCVDASDNVYIADYLNNRIRKVDVSTGIISTIAGTGVAGYNGDGILATTAQLNIPFGVFVDASGNLYIGDRGNNRIRKVTNVFIPGIIVNVASTNINCPGVCIGTATVTATGGTGPYTYNWSNNQTTQSISNLCVGTYTVTVSDAASAVVTYSVSIVALHSLPTILITPNSAMCSGDAPLSIGAVGAVTYTWNPATGLSTTTGSPITASPPTGINTYTVTGVDGNGCINDASVTITVNSLPSVYVSSSISVCVGSSNVLSATGNSISYDWSPSNGLNTASGTTVTFSPTLAGVYNFSVTGSDATCTNTGNITVKVNTLPTIYAGNDQVLCQGFSTSLSAFGPTGNYVWTPSTGLNNNTTSNVTASPTITISYTVTGTDVNGCTSYDGVMITVSSLLIANAGNDVSICYGSSTTLTASGGSTYSWLPTESLSIIAIYAIASPTTTTTYTLNIIDPCPTVPDYVTVTVFSLPTITVSSNVTICEGSPTPPITASGAVTYSWNPGAPGNSNVGSTVTVSPLSTTTYTVTGTDANGCSSYNTITVDVDPFFPISAGPDITITLGEAVTLLPTAVTGATYSWSPSDNLSCTNCQNPVANPPNTIIYVLTVNNGVCTSADSITVYVKCNDVFVPTAFSPNGDTYNDVLYVKSVCIKTLISFTIYDRWGEKVFETSDMTKGWDGMYLNKTLEPDVFVYLIKGTGTNDEEITKKGNISLIK